MLQPAPASACDPHCNAIINTIAYFSANGFSLIATPAATAIVTNKKRASGNFSLTKKQTRRRSVLYSVLGAGVLAVPSLMLVSGAAANDLEKQKLPAGGSAGAAILGLATPALFAVPAVVRGNRKAERKINTTLGLKPVNKGLQLVAQFYLQAN